MLIPWIPVSLATLITLGGFLDAQLGWPLFRAALSVVSWDLARLAWQAHGPASVLLHSGAFWVLLGGLRCGRLIGTVIALLVYLATFQLAEVMQDCVIEACIEALDPANPLGIQNWLALGFALAMPMVISGAQLNLMRVFRDGGGPLAR